MIVEGPPGGGLFDSQVDKYMSSHFLFSDAVVEYLVTKTENERGQSLTNTPGTCRCSSSSAGSTSIDVTMETSVEQFDCILS